MSYDTKHLYFHLSHGQAQDTASTKFINPRDMLFQKTYFLFDCEKQVYLFFTKNIAKVQPY